MMQVSTVEAVGLALEALGEQNFLSPILDALDISVKAEWMQGGVLAAQDKCSDASHLGTVDV